ncbi:MAG: iron ABC transporter permease [Bacteroidales bacterium]|jgi:iron complex transport system permease protein|nr:iron ABC transporter permease [Bacteroidales bacterium]
MNKKKNIFKFTILLFCFVLLIIVDLNTGHIKIPFQEILKFFSFSSNVSDDFFILIKEFRVPRVAVAILSGAALSVAGLMMQTLFRNPLAGPYVLGVSSGASLGVAIVVLGASFIFDQETAHSNYLILIAAGLGAAAVLALILSVSLRLKDILSILIIGILIAGVVNSIVSILQYYANDINVKSYVVWTMGSLNSVSFKDITILTPLLLISIAVIFGMSKSLNLILPGENFAKSMGVNLTKLRILIFIFVSILTGAVTAFCGPIGFIGVAAPHVARWFFNTSNHFILIPASVLLGAVFMLCGDLFSHIISSNGILPINAITSILGAPFIVWIVIQNKRTIV